MASIKWTQTEKNLLKSFAGESQARMRYDYFAKVAKNEWYEQISSIFEETALNEKEHAKRFFKFLEGGPVEITATYPAWRIWTTIENLEEAAAWENEEWTELYPEFARIADEEWFGEMAKVWMSISMVEKAHETRYRKLLANIQNDIVFKKEEVIKWKCRNCGYIHTGKNALDKCPSCDHPMAYFEVWAENY